MKRNIKICGVKTLEIANAVIDAGATHIGFVFFDKSPRNITSREMGDIAGKIKGKIKTVMVTVDPTDELISEALVYFRPDYIQLHGSETLQRVRDIKAKFNLKIIKAIPVSEKKDLENANQFKQISDYILFDAKPARGSNLPGGNAVSFDWKILEGFKPGYKWILSGGLAQENVNEALNITKAAFVDVSSGVESSAGNKDISMVKAFVKAVNEA